MKKIVSLILLFLTSAVLLGCNGLLDEVLDESPFEKEEEEEITMGPNEMAILLQNIDYSDVDQESMEYSIKGYMHVINSYHYDWDPENSYYTKEDMYLDLDLTLYLLAADLVENAEINLEGLMEMRSEYLNTSPDWGYEDLVDIDVAINAYMYDGYFYLNPVGTISEDGDIETLNFKERLIDAITQTDYEEMINELLWEVGLDDFDDLEAMIDADDLDELLAEIPIITIYQDGNITTIEFNVTKDAIREHGVDMLLAIADFIGEEAPSQADIDELQTELDRGLEEYIEHLDITYRLSIVGTKIHSMSYDIRLYFDDEDDFLDIDMQVSTTFGVAMPNRPNDLDDYEKVDDFDID